MNNKIQDLYKTSKSYPELVKGFLGLGMISYTVIVSTGSTIYRFPDKDPVIHHPGGNRKVAEKYDHALTMQAVKDTQQGKTTYPQFMDAIAVAGVNFYEVSLGGKIKKVVYCGVGGQYEETIPV